MIPKVNIIMVNYNGERYLGANDLADAIESFLRTNYPNFAFIFIDNNSTDNSIIIAKEIFKKYPHIKTRILQNEKNLGFAGGCEMGLLYAKGEYICLLNNDDKALNSSWLFELMRNTETDGQTGALFGKKLKWDKPEEVDARGLTMNPVGLIHQTTLEDKISECLIWQTPVLIKRSIIEKIGGLFDDDYVILNDDTDSSLRIWLAGYKILYVPSAVVFHKRSATMKSLPVEFIAFHGRKNTIQTLLKNYELKNLIKWLPITLSVYTGAMIYYIYRKRIDQSKATLKALLWNMINLRKIWQKRRYVQDYVRTTDDNAVFKLMPPFNIIYTIKSEKVWPR
jgi:GT2 family glycosyltransferase